MNNSALSWIFIKKKQPGETHAKCWEIKFDNDILLCMDNKQHTNIIGASQKRTKLK